MSDTMNETPDTQTVPAQSTVAQPDIMAMLAQMSDQLQRIADENAALKRQMDETAVSTPKMRRMETPDLHNVGTRREQVFNSLSGTQQREGALDQIPVDHLGHRIDPTMLRHMGPAFRVGDPVRVNPKVSREGAREGVTWGDVLDKARTDGYGTVLRVLWYGKGGYWKYKVRIPGFTGPYGDGFYSYELLEA